jgi:4'-phosphopantetheinyl transferase
MKSKFCLDNLDNLTHLLNRNPGEAIKIWCFVHNNIPLNPFAYSKILDQNELSKARNYISPKDKFRYINDRVNIKKILSNYNGTKPSDVKISYNENGKPFQASSNIEFNISHSWNLSVYAFSTRSKIGIDLEEIREIPNLDLLIKHFFTKKETKHVNKFKKWEKTKAFLQIWTEKEAICKMLGIGVSYLDKNQELPEYPVEKFSLNNRYVGALSFHK